MFAALLSGLVAANAGVILGHHEDRVETTIDASVSQSLDRVQINLRAIYTPGAPLDGLTIVNAAHRYRQPPDPLPPASERSLFFQGFDPGGFEQLSIKIDGRACSPTVEAIAGGQLLRCPGTFAAKRALTVEIDAALKVPARYGPFGQASRELNLAGAWYPYLARPQAPPPKGACVVRLTIPGQSAAVIGGRYFPPSISPARRTIEASLGAIGQVSVVVRPAHTHAPGLSGGRVRFVTRRASSKEDTARQAEVLKVLGDALRFLIEEGLALPTQRAPLVVVDAKLRHNLARATERMVLLSDRAFRILPLSRAFRFHRFPVLREIFTAYWLARIERGPHAHIKADALGAWMVDRYVASRYGRAEDAFDVLSLWSFIPAIDSLLYAPQLPFVGAFFRLIKEEDPLRPNLIDFPDLSPRGKIIYEKLLDRFGRTATDQIFVQLTKGEGLHSVLQRALGNETSEFLRQWLGTYPKVQYRLSQYFSRPGTPKECGRGPCVLASATIERIGEAVSEPIQVRFVDDDDHERLVWSKTTRDATRVVTATLSAALDLVEIDPFGRVSESPSKGEPSPRFDNRSSPRWRVLLNNFNVLLSATAGNIDTALDLGWSRVRDLNWRFAARASYSPSALALSSRAVYGFGQANTSNQLSQWVGVLAAGEWLRPGFAGAEQGAYAASGSVFYGYDNRRTVWMPEPGTGFRASLAYSHVFGQLTGEEVGATRDSLSLTVRAMHAFRFNASHQLAFRASLGAYLLGTPRRQLLYNLGGRRSVRAYDVGEVQGRARGIISAEWVHPIAPRMDTNAVYLVWLTGLDGALYADAALISDRVEDFFKGPVFADVGYGLRLYLDYFGVRPGVMAVDLAFPLVDPRTGRFGFGSPAVYIDFSQSFFAF